MKQRVISGRVGSVRKVTRYVDPTTGQPWHGLECPSCRGHRRNLGLRAKKQVQELLGPEEVDQELSGRLCRACKNPLPKSKYFYHDGCYRPSIYDLLYGIEPNHIEGSATNEW